MNEVINQNEFIVFPNPSTNVFNLRVNSDLIGSVYTIYDINGKTIFSDRLKEETTKIDLSSLSNGIYLIGRKNDAKESIRLIKEKYDFEKSAVVIIYSPSDFKRGYAAKRCVSAF